MNAALGTIVAIVGTGLSCQEKCVDKIETPPDDYESNTIGNQGLTMEQIIQQRNSEVSQNNKPNAMI